MNADATKAYFTFMNVGAGRTYGLLKEGSAFIAPTPNNQNLAGKCSSLYDERVIFTYVCSADVNADGSFTNLTKLDENVNLGGLNAISSVSPDGKTLFVEHMTMDSTFWSSNWGPDGLCLQITMTPANMVEPWAGYVTQYELEGTRWIPVANYVSTNHKSSSTSSGSSSGSSSSGTSSSDSIIIIENEAAFRSSHPWIPADSIIHTKTENGKTVLDYIEDKYNLPFETDARVSGTVWTSVDFVNDKEDFTPGVKNWNSSLFLDKIVFNANGSTNYAWSWTKGYLLHDGDKTAETYEIVTIEGTEYMFFQWKSGDYSHRACKPSYYVLCRQ